MQTRFRKQLSVSEEIDNVLAITQICVEIFSITELNHNFEYTVFEYQKSAICCLIRQKLHIGKL